MVKSINLGVFKSVHGYLELSNLCFTHCLIWDVGSGLVHGSVAYLSACCLDKIHTCTSQRWVHKRMGLLSQIYHSPQSPPWSCFSPSFAGKAGFDAMYFPHLCLWYKRQEDREREGGRKHNSNRNLSYQDLLIRECFPPLDFKYCSCQLSLLLLYISLFGW